MPLQGPHEDVITSVDFPLPAGTGDTGEKPSGKLAVRFLRLCSVRREW
jgi:hypothetical protein